MLKSRFAALVAGILTLSLIGCSSKDRAVLNVSVDGAKNAPVVLSLLNINKIEVVDSLSTNEAGKVKFKVKLPHASPNFYYLNYKGKRIASVLLSPKDVVNLTIDTLGNNLTISGSQEAELYVQIIEGINAGQKKFDSLTLHLFDFEDNGDDANAQRIREELGKLYVKEKQSSVVKLIQNPNSFTNITLLFRQFNENLPLFASLTDGIYYMQVADSLKKIYPDSPYVKALEKEAEEFGKSMELREKLRQAGHTAFPDIKMTDVNSNTVELSSLLGHPFILLFWSTQESSQKMLNAELETIYNKFASKGLEIFSVCCDTDRTYWAQIVKRLPWINVCDGKGSSSEALRNYNVTEIPTLFLFDREGDIVARDLFDLKELEAAISKL